jgi:hypothetical protein
MSNIGDWSNWRSGRPLFGGKLGGLGAAAWKKESCIDISSASAPGVEEEPLEPGGLAEAAISGGLSRTIESAEGQQLPTEFGGVHTAFRSRRRRFI